jgi:hypothetical protein
MYNMMDIDFPIIGAAFGLITIVFGSFILMNLILAVIIDTFIELQEAELKKELKDKKLQNELIVSDDDI